MSAKVSRHIRKQRRARKRALKHQQREARRTPDSPRQPATATAASAEQTSATPHPRHGEQGNGSPSAASTQTSAQSRAARLTAVLAGCGLVAVAIGSAAFHIAAPDQQQTLRTPTNYIAAPAVTERLVCPPTPGAPATLSDAGVLEYEERDDSAETSRRGVLFASSSGVLPHAESVPISEDGRGEPTLFQEEAAEQDDTPLLAQRQLNIGDLVETDAPTLLEVQPLEDLGPEDAPAAAASFTYHADEGPQSGLSTAHCSLPQRSQWFLGPATGSGAASLLTLTNPHSRDATVEVTTFSSEGETGSLGDTTLLVPADSVRTVNMAALTEDAAQLAVHVQAAGAPVAGHFQTSFAAGSSGQGTDLLPGIEEPGTEHHMLAVPGDTEQRPQLWIHTPGEDGAEVELQVFDVEGQAAIETPGVFSVEAGQVSVVDIEGLESGTYEVVVRTDEPSVAAVRSSGDGQPVTVETALPSELDPITGESLEPETIEEETDPAADISWTASADLLRPGFGTLIPQVGQTDLRFFGEGQLSYRLLDSTGQTSEDLSVEIPAESGLEIPHEQLEEQAQAADLEDTYALVVTEVMGESRAGTVTRDDQGYFSIGTLEPISPTAQYVPLRFDH